MARIGTMSRKTRETDILVEVNLDGTGAATIQTGVGFLDHMLELFARHSLIDLTISAQGDLHVDDHHTVEDVGICLGQALAEALGEKRGIQRYGDCLLPMDETLVACAIDLSGRACLIDRVSFPSRQIGTFATELIEEFWQGWTRALECNLHFVLQHGTNSHHIAEAMFKSCARALRMAVAEDPRAPGQIPSTKGTLG